MEEKHTVFFECLYVQQGIIPRINFLFRQRPNQGKNWRDQFLRICGSFLRNREFPQPIKTRPAAEEERLKLISAHTTSVFSFSTYYLNPFEHVFAPQCRMMVSMALRKTMQRFNKNLPCHLETRLVKYIDKQNTFFFSVNIN